MNIANRELSRFSASIWIVIAAFLVFACSFIVYVRAEKAIDRANELRMEALRLGAELRQSSEDLTNGSFNVRLYRSESTDWADEPPHGW